MAESTSDWVGSISDVIADQIRELRRREGLTREELASAAHRLGLPATFTATALGNIETGRRDKDGRRRREVTVDELAALAAAAGRSPLDLLGATAELFTGEPTECHRCTAGRGELERTIRADVAALEETAGGMRASLAQTAYVLAEAIDNGGGEAGKQLPQLAKELRATLELLAVNGPADPDDEDDDLGDLDQPE